MRIIAGTWRGRTIDAPAGEHTRPTIDRVRESLMSALSSARGGFEGAVVLDAFAGSGALGLEALSRGAAEAWLCERDRAALAVLRRNVEKLAGGSGSAVVRGVDVLASPPRPPRPFDLVLLDPPYATDPAAVFGMVDRLADAGSLSPDALLTYEHAGSDDVVGAAEAAAAGWRARASKTYGRLAVDIFERAVVSDGVGAGSEAS